MNLKRNFLIILFFLIPVSRLLAEDTEFKKDNFKENKDQFKEAVKDLEIGDRSYNVNPAAAIVQYAMALPHHLKAHKLKPTNSQLNYNIGVCHLNSLHKTAANPFLETAYRLKPNIDPKTHYTLRNAYHLNMEWD